MYICPFCKNEYEKESRLTKHYLKCWKEKNPFSKSKELIESEAIETRKDNEDIVNFFASLQRR